MRLEGQWLAPSLPRALPLSTHPSAAHRWTVQSSTPAAALNRPWGLQLGNMVADLFPPSVENCLTLQLSSGALCLLPECCPFSGFLDAHRVTGRYCLIRVFFYTVGDSGIVASPLLHITCRFSTTGFLQLIQLILRVFFFSFLFLKLSELLVYFCFEWVFCFFFF